ncbi:ATP-binding cassette sub-family G member 1-like [Harmonia axyridis]|uniref:ATP-binding cassette sub-family G member 1-like n=1 Tax=Harmonia axyridis TaxID=115357 RepID=UPI001E278895|nr:ATP-binding cassette sub-family G member 1-like [Harmonia axyridis]XP_045480297.1 ATP-binding cassette sub-family G member 1-like [Harmonia axyridis]XP_045480298.1 ATP-binding cassette sub-family G member 1-like [Harmonia axyridis]XP_045480299.1 ATP-binding cassette sub-family G member 1-like [Harmonia axyridis]XP_045480300.1 ATP-binding cassette sub-family G member 1-like [Harmonia axyridis]
MEELKSINIQIQPTGDTQAQSVCYKVNESLNNACDTSEQQITPCNGPTPMTINTNGGTLRKVPNKNSPGSYKKPTIMLSHLPKRPPVDIQFNDLSYSISEGRKRGYKTILKGVNGTFKSGELTAIMGPSGAGKSTLMNILAGYKTSNLTGSVLINGKERSLRRFRKMSCYIMQDDCLSPHLTVKEALTVSANLKLGKSISRADKKIVVKEVVEALGLQECIDTHACSLSGGQRKRLSIALEMVNNPPVMFFDEPTSGLDSSTCFQCLCLLKSLARGGRTIICTIHQPSARLFEMFDHLYILAEGQCIYRGVVKGLVPFLSSMGLNCPSYHNPADYVMEVASGEHGDYVQKLVVAVNDGMCTKTFQQLALKEQEALEAKKIKNDISKSQVTPESIIQNGISKGSAHAPTCTTSLLDSSDNLAQLGLQSFPASGLLQFWILLKRTTYIILRDKMLTRLRLLSHVVIGILLGLIYYDIGNDAAKVMSNAGCLFFITLFTMFTSMMPTILTFPVEMSVFVREHLNYWYSVKAYYFAKTLADIPFQIVMTMGYVMGVYYLTAQPMEFTRFSMVLIISVATALVGQSFGLLVGAAFSIESGVFLGPISTIPMVLFSGFFANLDDIPYYLKWLPYASYVKYSFEGTMIAIYGLDRKKLDCKNDYCHFKYPKQFLEDMSMKDDMNTFIINVSVLIGIFLTLRFFTYFVLRIKLRQNR